MADYRTRVVEARRRRDTLIDAANREARETIAAAVADRDRMILELRSQGLTRQAIASLVGCHMSLVYDVLNPDKRVAYNERRREHARHLRLVA